MGTFSNLSSLYINLSRDLHHSINNLCLFAPSLSVDVVRWAGDAARLRELFVFVAHRAVDFLHSCENLLSVHVSRTWVALALSFGHWYKTSRANDFSHHGVCAHREAIELALHAVVSERVTIWAHRR